MPVAKLSDLPSDPKVAIIHDWFVGGGAEKVVEALHQLYPDAPIYTSYISPEWRKRLEDATIITGYLQHWPFSILRKFIPPLRQIWFSHLRLKKFDIIISSSGAEAKGVRRRRGQLHVSYCHAPTHYYWSRYDQYMRSPGFGIFNPLARLGLRALITPMRKWDYRAAQGPNVMIANSTHIAAEIKKYYKRDAIVIAPPVDTSRFESVPAHTQRNGFVIAGRQVPYKRIDLAISACNELSLPLNVIGNGPEHVRLRRTAGPTITFLSNISDKDMPKHFASAEAFIFPGLDDFGITPVEAMAAGTPVIAYKAGGALDYVIDNVTGVLFKDQTIDSLSEALLRFQKKQYSADRIRRHARDFSVDSFKSKFDDFVFKAWSQKK